MSSGVVQPLITPPHNSTPKLKAGAPGMVPGDPCRKMEDRQMNDYKLLIDGKLVSGAMALDVVNPATEDVVAVALCVPKIRFGVDAAGGRRKLAS
jgi:hypothetical protein